MDSEWASLLSRLQKGFSGVCIGSTILGRWCFFLDIIVLEGEVVIDQPTAALLTEARPQLHDVGDHTVRDEPLTVRAMVDAHPGAPFVSLCISRTDATLNAEEYASVLERFGAKVIAKPRIGDIYRFSPEAVVLSGTARPARFIMGVPAMQLNLMGGGLHVLRRAEPHRPADFADRWEVVRRHRAEEKKPVVDAAPTGRSGHAGRFGAVVDWLTATFSPTHVLDIAGGNGKLSCHLACTGISSTVIDPRVITKEKLSNVMLLAIKQIRHKEHTVAHFTARDVRHTVHFEDADRLLGHVSTIEALFDQSAIPDFDRIVRGASVLVGLHCDGAVNAIIDAACTHQRPFVIIPCCVFPGQFPRTLKRDEGGFPLTFSHLSSGAQVAAESPVTTLDELVAWIPQECARLGFGGAVHCLTLPGLTGANTCVYGTV